MLDNVIHRWILCLRMCICTTVMPCSLSPASWFVCSFIHSSSHNSVIISENRFWESPSELAFLDHFKCYLKDFRLYIVNLLLKGGWKCLLHKRIEPQVWRRLSSYWVFKDKVESRFFFFFFWICENRGNSVLWIYKGCVSFSCFVLWQKERLKPVRNASAMNRAVWGRAALPTTLLGENW